MNGSLIGRKLKLSINYNLIDFPVTQDVDEETKQVCPSDGNGVLVLDCPQATVYVRFPNERELKVLHYVNTWVYCAKRWLHCSYC